MSLRSTSAILATVFLAGTLVARAGEADAERRRETLFTEAHLESVAVGYQAPTQRLAEGAGGFVDLLAEVVTVCATVDVAGRNACRGEITKELFSLAKEYNQIDDPCGSPTKSIEHFVQLPHVFDVSRSVHVLGPNEAY